MKFRIGDTVIIEYPKSSIYSKYDGCVCTVKDVDGDATNDYVKVDVADNNWWPVNYIRRYEPDEEIDADDLFDIM